MSTTAQALSSKSGRACSASAAGAVELTAAPCASPPCAGPLGSAEKRQPKLT
jgi:hypothetical protein